MTRRVRAVAVGLTAILALTAACSDSRTIGSEITPAAISNSATETAPVATADSEIGFVAPNVTITSMEAGKVPVFLFGDC